MKIDFIGSKHDLTKALKKAAAVGNLEQLDQLAEHITADVELDNLKEKVSYQAYKTTVQQDAFQIEKVTMSYDPLTDVWNEDNCTVVYKIPFEVIEKEQPE